GRDGEHIHQGNAAEEMFLRIVKHPAHGSMVAPHYPLYPVEGTEHMGLVYHAAAAASDEYVLAVIGHPHHFMRHDLAYRNDQVVCPVHYALVHFHVHRVRNQPVGNLRHIFCRDLADPDHILPPVVDNESIMWYVPA